MKYFVRPDALKEEFTTEEPKKVTSSVVKVIETDLYPINHYFG